MKSTEINFNNASAVFVATVFVLCAFVTFQNLSFAEYTQIESETVVNITNSTKDIEVNEHVLVHEDTTNSLMIDKLVSGRYNPFLESSAKKNMVHGYNTNTFWFKVKFKNSTDTFGTWKLNIIGNRFSTLNSYIVRDEIIIKKERHGYKIPRTKRGGYNPTPAVDLSLEPSELITLYLELKSEDVLKLQMRLQNKEAYSSTETTISFLLGIYFGCLTGLILYHLFLFISLKDVNYLNYVIFSSSMAVISFTYLGYADHFGFNWSGFYWQEHLGVLRAFVPIAATLFLRQFLRTKELMPILDTVIRIFMGIAVFTLVMFTIFWGNAQLLIIDALNMVGVTLALTATIKALYAGFKPARYFLASWGFFIPMIIIWTLTNQGVLEVNFFTRYAPQIGNFGEIILMAFALADRINSLKIAKNAAEVKGANTDEMRRLIRVMCHDICNPASVIEGTCKTVKNKSLKEKDLYWAHIEKANKVILAITENVKKMESLGSRKTRVDIRPVNLANVIIDAAFLFKQKIENKGIKFTTPPLALLEKTVVYAEETSLTNNVFNNILSNSIKFTKPKGEISISLVEDGDDIIITISDTGIGIPSDILDKIFDNSARTSRKGTDGEKGTGFGMPLVKEYVEYFGGKIELESKDQKQHPENHGTSVHITLRKAYEPITRRTDLF